MNSDLIMKIFLVEYIICAGVCIYEGSWGRFWYWISASGLTASVIWGMKGKF